MTSLSAPALLLVALGVSADAFAVAVGRGLGLVGDRTAALRLAVAFGLFQGLMPLLGWLVGSGLSEVAAGAVAEVDHWIAFALLSLVGVRMLREALALEEERRPGGRLGWRELLVLSVATSIDALAVGVGFAFLDVDVLRACLLIGGTTLLVTALGVAVGRLVGTRARRPAEVLGGLVLIGIGVRILVDHLGA